MKSINETIRQELNAARGLVSITALKKDGSQMTLVTSMPWTRAQGPVRAVSVAGSRAAETRAMRHPDLINVRDMRAYRKALKAGKSRDEAYNACWRSFDLSRVLTIAANGQRHELRISNGS